MVFIWAVLLSHLFLLADLPVGAALFPRGPGAAAVDSSTPAAFSLSAWLGFLSYPTACLCLLIFFWPHRCLFYFLFYHPCNLCVFIDFSFGFLLLNLLPFHLFWS